MTVLWVIMLVGTLIGALISKFGTDDLKAMAKYFIWGAAIAMVALPICKFYEPYTSFIVVGVGLVIVLLLNINKLGNDDTKALSKYFIWAVVATILGLLVSTFCKTSVAKELKEGVESVIKKVTDDTPPVAVVKHSAGPQRLTYVEPKPVQPIQQNNSNVWICHKHHTKGLKTNPNMPACPVCSGKFGSVEEGGEERVVQQFQQSRVIERQVRVQPQVRVVQVPVYRERVVQIPIQQRIVRNDCYRQSMSYHPQFRSVSPAIRMEPSYGGFRNIQDWFNATQASRQHGHGHRR